MAIHYLVFGTLILGIFIVTTITLYNGFISLQNQIDRAWSNIDVILRQRHDEIPGLIQILEQFAGFEKQLIQRILDARTRYGVAGNDSLKVRASRDLSLALRGVFALSEGFPELRTSSGFIQIQDRLSELESQLTDRREVYNEAVTNWNTKLSRFPEVVFTMTMKLEHRPLFQISDHERSKTSIKMGLGGK